MANGPNQQWQQSRRRSSKSGIYAKFIAAATSRSRKTSLSSTASIDGKRLVMAEDSIRSQADIDSDLKMIYGEAKMRPNPSPQMLQVSTVQPRFTGDVGQHAFDP